MSKIDFRPFKACLHMQERAAGLHVANNAFDVSLDVCTDM